MPNLQIICLSLAAVVLIPPLSAQGNSLLYRLDGANAGDHFGHAMDHLADLDGDGLGDFVVSAPFASPGGLAGAGSAFVYSGATGSLLYTFHGEGAGDGFGSSLANIGDADGDGFDDIALGAPFADFNGLLDNGAVYVYSGASGLLLNRFEGQFDDGQLGRSVSWFGDANGDGLQDLLTAEPNHSPAPPANPDGKIFVFDVLSGTSIHEYFDERPVGDPSSFGHRVVGLGDLNGDSSPDLATTYGHFQVQLHATTIRRGDDGNFLMPIWIDDLRRPTFTASYVNLGDLNGDGVNELGLADSDYDFSLPSGVVMVFSGIDASLMYEWQGVLANDRFGMAMSSAGDINGDGVADILFGSGERWIAGGTNTVHAHSGADGSLLFQIPGANAFGAALSKLDDADGDGLDDFLVGAPLTQVGLNPEAGSIYVYH